MVMSTTGHKNHCLLIACDFVMIAKCLESFTNSFKGFGIVGYNQNWLWLYYTRNDVNHILFTDLTELCKILFTSSFQGLKGVS